MNRFAANTLKKAILSIVIVVAVIFIPYHLAFAKKIIPGVWLGHINLSGKELEQAYRLTDAYFAGLEKATVTFTAAGQKEAARSAEIGNLGVSLDTKETVVAAYRIGRSGNIVKDTSDKIRGFSQPLPAAPSYQIKAPIFKTRINKLFSDLETSFQESTLKLTPTGEITFVEGRVGKVVDTTNLQNCLMEHVDTMKLDNATCQVSFKEQKPQYTRKDFENIKDQVTSLSETELTVSWVGGSRILSGNELLELFDVEPQGLFPSLEKVVVYVEELASSIDRHPVNATFEEKEEGKLALFTLAENGIRVLQDQLVEEMVETLNKVTKATKVTDETEATKSFEITVETETIEPEIKSVENSYGIKELLGKGLSNYHGSIPNRIYNIKHASSILNGRLIEPGQVVSFNNLLGDVSPESGYKSAYVIINNKTVLGAGGGVCQTSTTMFRAAMDAGLPILDRTAHLYRVHYYEPPLGMDATVMHPYTDFVFQNDTPAYILIQTHVNEATEDVTYTIFGTSDGRKVTISEPAITNQSGYPATRYQDDPTLEKGKTTQVEWAAGGATATVNRRVTRDQEILQEDTFVSSYVPWAAVFLVGTKE